MSFGLLLTVLAVTAVSCLMAETRVGMRGRDSTTDGRRPAVSQLVSRRTVRDAGRIFSGSVMSVERAKASGAVTTTQITFRVEEAIRGVRRWQTLTISEWSVLWESGGRYRVGKRVLLFLYPASRLGLTSPVGGAIGRFRVDSRGRVELKPERSKKPALTRAPSAWIEVRAITAAIRSGVEE